MTTSPSSSASAPGLANAAPEPGSTAGRPRPGTEIAVGPGFRRDDGVVIPAHARPGAEIGVGRQRYFFSSAPHKVRRWREEEMMQPTMYSDAGASTAEWLVIELAEPDFSALSMVELTTARLILEGKSTAEAARVRGVSKRTVAHQLERVFQKLGVSSRSELACLASEGAA